MAINVAIDGPAGAGKSTISRKAAEKLGYIYVDTGALYRTVGLNAVRAGADLEDPESIKSTLEGLTVDLTYKDGEQAVLLNKEDVSSLIRTPDASMAASKVSAVPAVREFLFELQKDIARKNNCVMDGRDIGTVVLPDAKVKIFLTASAQARAKRRYDELVAKGQDVNFDDVLEDMKQRDYNDTHREIAPLKQAYDAVLVDTTELDLQQSIDAVVETINRKLAENVGTREGAHIKGKDFDFSVTRDRRFCKGLVKVAGPSIRKFFDAQYFGVENIPAEGKLIIACNHRSYYDPFLLCAGKIRSIHYMAKLELFSVNPAVSWFLRHCNAFPIKRGQHDTEAMEYAAKVVNEGKVLGIFPEGTRSIQGERLRPKLGVARIANATHADVLPACIYYEGDDCSKKGKTTVRFGEVIPYEELHMSDDASKEELINAATIIMEKIGDLLDKKHSKD